MTSSQDDIPDDVSRTLPLLSHLFQDSGAAVFFFDEDDRLIYGNAEYYRLICHAPGTNPTWPEIIRDNFEHKHGLLIEADDVESWIETTRGKRRSRIYRQFETDTWDGRWLLITETWIPEFGLLGVGVDITQTVRSSETLKREYQNAQKRAETDVLTEFGNRRALEKLRIRLLNGNHHVSALIIDIDQFKSYNDSLDHSQGDLCLQQVARIFRGVLNEDKEYPIRLGGDEFLVLIPDSETPEALQVAQRIMDGIRDARIAHPCSESGCVSMSIGVASQKITNSQSFSALLKEADESLYKAKHQGRNRFEHA